MEEKLLYASGDGSAPNSFFTTHMSFSAWDENNTNVHQTPDRKKLNYLF